MVSETPFRHDRAAPRNDAGHALRRQRNVAKPDAGVHGEVVHALLRLLDERVAVDFPGELLRLARDLLERLVDRNRPDRHGRIADDPLPRLVDVLSGRQVHHGVGAPADRPRHFFDFLFDRGGYGRVADVRVDLHEESPPQDHRFELRMVDVRGNDRPAARDLRANELGRALLADRDVLHLRSDGALPGEMHLRRVSPASEHFAPRRKRKVRVAVAGHEAIGRGDAVVRPPSRDPSLPQRGKALRHVDRGLRVRVRPRRVVEAHGQIRDGLARSGSRRRERDFAERHAQASAALDVDFSRPRQGLRRDGGVRRRVPGRGPHAAHLMIRFYNRRT